MITARIVRGALRTKNLGLRTLESTAYRLIHAPKRISPSRALTMVIVAARMSFAPVPVAQAASIGTADQDGLPPSTVAAVSFSATAAEPLVVATPGLSPITVVIATPEPTPAATPPPTPVPAPQPVDRPPVVRRVAALPSAPPAAQPAPNNLAAEIASRITAERGASEAEALLYIAERESGVNLNSYNTSSGACGIWQALPCSKMGGMDFEHQYNWVRGYALGRYGSYVNAKAFWLSHHWW